MAELGNDPGHKMVPEPGKFLIDSGLLFAINRTVLHPLGLALALHMTEDYKIVNVELWDSRDDPEGIIFVEELLEEGEKKLKKFFEAYGTKKHQERLEKLGYIFQYGKDNTKHYEVE